MRFCDQPTVVAERLVGIAKMAVGAGVSFRPRRDALWQRSASRFFPLHVLLPFPVLALQVRDHALPVRGNPGLHFRWKP